MEIINPWKVENPRKFDVDKPIFVYKDYAIYKLYDNDYLYTYKNFAFNELAGKNKKHLMAVANRDGQGFLYDRAIETLKRMA